jgi:hypothetical protein
MIAEGIPSGELAKLNYLFPGLSPKKRNSRRVIDYPLTLFITQLWACK